MISDWMLYSNALIQFLRPFLTKKIFNLLVCLLFIFEKTKQNKTVLVLIKVKMLKLADIKYIQFLYDIIIIIFSS